MSDRPGERSLVERLRDKADKMPKWEGHRCVDAVLMLEAAAALAQWEARCLKAELERDSAREQFDKRVEWASQQQAQWEERWRALAKMFDTDAARHLDDDCTAEHRDGYAAACNDVQAEMQRLAGEQ